MEQELSERWQSLIAQGKSFQQAEQTLLQEFARKYGARNVMEFARSLRVVQTVQPSKRPSNPIFEGCDKDDEGNVLDPIFHDEIPEELLFSFIENGRKYCFNIRTFAEYVRRSRPENPLTRRPLSQEVVNALEEYEERERFLTSLVSFYFEGHPSVMPVRHIKGDSFGELIINVYRALSDSTDHKISSLELLTEFIVDAIGITSIKDVIDQPVKLAVEDRQEKPWKLQANYYFELWVFCEERFSLQSFADAAIETFQDILLDVPFIETVEYFILKFQGNNYFTSYDGLQIESVAEYYKTNRELFGDNAYILYNSPLALPIPKDYSFKQTERNRYLQQVLSESYLNGMTDAITKQNSNAVEEFFSLYKAVTGETTIPVDSSSIFKNFNTIEACKLLKLFEVNYTYIFPRKFIEEDGVACLYDLAEKEPIRKTLLGKKVFIRDSRAQAIVVLLTNNKSLFHRYKKTLNENVLYEGIAQKNSNLYDALSQEQKVEYTFQTGIVGDELGLNLLKRALNACIVNRNEFHKEAFNAFIGRLSREEITGFLNLAIKHKSEDVLLSILHVTYGTTDTESYIRLICNLMKRPDGPFKSEIITQVFVQIESDEVVRFYQCLPAKFSCLGYIARVQTLETTKPEFSLQASLHLLDSELAADVIQYGLVADDIIIDLINLSTNKVGLLDDLSLEQLRKVSLKSLQTYALNKQLQVRNPLVRSVLLNNQEFQDFLVDYMIRKHIRSSETNLLTFSSEESHSRRWYYSSMLW